MFALFSIVLGTFVHASKFYIDPTTQTIRDSQGRHTILHGVNAVYKVAPYISLGSVFDS